VEGGNNAAQGGFAAMFFRDGAAAMPDLTLMELLNSLLTGMAGQHCMRHG
jgi:hypothetical protein